MSDIRDNRPELLAPAGDMECLCAALDFGADAVYLAGQMFGMRTAPSNFTREELQTAVALAHARGVRVYVTCNTVPPPTRRSTCSRTILHFCRRQG